MKSNRDSGAEHFSEAMWADFARNVGSGERRAEMQSHLEGGCLRCRGIADRLTAIVRMAANERNLLIPQDFIERAKGISQAVPEQSGWIENLNVIVAHLIGTGPPDWQPAGVRSVEGDPGAASGRMIFQAEDFAVYLKVEPLPGGEAVEIIGEIANEHAREESMEGIPVQMVAKGETLSESATNRFGEFLIEYPARKSATLRFALRNRGQRIDLPLGFEPGSAGEGK